MRHKDAELLEAMYDYVVQYKKMNSISPSYGDIGNHFGINRSTACRYMKVLEQEGKLELLGHRSVRITEETKTDSVVQVPVLGNIACGAPIFADGRIDSYMALSQSIVKGKECFIVTAQGDSMINAGINDGDLVLVEAASTADEGSIVVALIDDEATLKRFYIDKDNQKILLVPENDNYETRIVDHCIIQGIARKVIKDLG
ncbi:MAG: transcriptional repressor LexA [Oscillospiraceae bacterium]|nr:transcriptional repressor LexA [Oscillospiraceae bacterium]